MSSFDGKVVLVTGGAGGQGESHARRFIAEGAHVVITDIADDKGRALAESLGDKATYMHHDVSSEDEWKAVIDAIDKKHGKLDVLINNAGLYKPASIADTDYSSLRLTIDINQVGVFLGMKFSADLLAKSGSGSIINVSSLAGLRGFPNAIAYVGTKWAVRGMTKTAAAELAGNNIRVNSIHPGFIDTVMLEENDPSVNKEGQETTPLKRLGTPGEITDLIVFLASDQSSYITGAEVAIDGGLSV